MNRAWLILLLAALAFALPQLGSVGNWMFDVAWGAEEGTVAVKITPDLALTRKEVYLGEKLWLAFQVKNAYSPCPISIEVVDMETGEVVFQRSGVLNVCGGQMLGGTYWIGIIPDFTVVQPVYEGRRYKVVVRAGGEWGAYTYTERHNPVGKIVSMTVFQEGRVATRLKAGASHVVRVTVENRGEVDYSFKVTLLVDGRVVNETKVFVLSKRRADATLFYTPREVGTVNLTVAVGGVVQTDAQSAVFDVVYPTPKFLLVAPKRLTARLGEDAQFSITLKNYGEACPAARVSVEDPFDVAYKSATVPTGGELSVGLTYRGAEVASGVARLAVYCGGYVDYVDVPYEITAKMKVAALSEDGRPLQAQILVNGTSFAEGWLPRGVYVVEAPAYVPISADARWAFVRWNDGVAQNKRSITLSRGVDVVAYYRLEVRVRTALLKTRGL